MKTFNITIFTTFDTKVFTVKARSSAAALLKLADKLPLFGMTVVVKAA